LSAPPSPPLQIAKFKMEGRFNYGHLRHSLGTHLVMLDHLTALVVTRGLEIAVGV
jgi:hypothetical protein